MCGHKGHGTELVECTADRTAVECTVVDYTVAVRWDFAVPVAAVVAVEQFAVPVVAAAVVEQSVVPVVAAAAVEQFAVPVAAVVLAAAVVGVLAVPAAEY